MRYLAAILIAVLFVTSAVSAQTTFNDPEIYNQWYLDSLRLSEIWSKSQGEGVVVAVLDSGVDSDHPDLINQMWINLDEIEGDGVDNDMNGFVDDRYGWDFVASDATVKPEGDADCLQNGPCSEDAYDHGTIIAGIAGAEANNAFGIAGIAPRAKIMPLRVLDSSGQGNSANVIKAIDYAVANGADIINMSFVGPDDDTALAQAVRRATEASVLVVIAAGNEEVNGEPIDLDITPRYPICSNIAKDYSLGVGSHDRQFKLSDFSNYGSCLDLLAPGENIFGLNAYEPSVGKTTYYDGGYRGTSLSAPMVAGSAALIKSYRPALSAFEIMSLIITHTQNISNRNPGFTGKIGSGALQLVTIFQQLSQQIPEQPLPSPELSGQLIKSSDNSAVYYVGNDGKRYVFPDSGTYFSWYPDFSNIQIVTAEKLASFQIGGLVTYRPGGQMLKIQSVNKVYAVAKNGTLRWIIDESVAQELYGPEWGTKVRDISDAFFSSYTEGDPIYIPFDYSPVQALQSSRTINEDKNL